MMAPPIAAPATTDGGSNSSQNLYWDCEPKVVQNRLRLQNQPEAQLNLAEAQFELRVLADFDLTIAFRSKYPRWARIRTQIDLRKVPKTRREAPVFIQCRQQSHSPYNACVFSVSYRTEGVERETQGGTKKQKPDRHKHWLKFELRI
jgi:hypothetical protein